MKKRVEINNSKSGSAKYEAVVIGASAGGFDAIKFIVQKLDFFEPPIVCVLHISPNYLSDMARLFRGSIKRPVIEVHDKTPICADTTYIAPPNYHLLIEDDRSFSLSVDKPIHHCRPSIDVLFESAARAYGHTLVGIILTGANRDGADGLRAVHDRGGLAIVQDPQTAEMPVMPKAAIEQTPKAIQLPLDQIPSYLLSVV